MGNIRMGLRSVVFDCADPVSLATFYGQLLDGAVDASDPDWCDVRVTQAGVKLSFQRAVDHRAPEWPHGQPQQIHLDFDVTDLDAASRRAVELGARVLGEADEGDGSRFVVHADPAGHPFCLCVQNTA